MYLCMHADADKVAPECPAPSSAGYASKVAIEPPIGITSMSGVGSGLPFASISSTSLDAVWVANELSTTPVKSGVYGVDAAWITSELPATLAGCTSFALVSTPPLYDVMQSFEDQGMFSVPPFSVGSDFESAPAENDTKIREAIAVVVEHQIEDVQFALANSQIKTDDCDAD